MVNSKQRHGSETWFENGRHERLTVTAAPLMLSWQFAAPATGAGGVLSLQPCDGEIMARLAAALKLSLAGEEVEACIFLDRYGQANWLKRWVPYQDFTVCFRLKRDPGHTCLAVEFQCQAAGGEAQWLFLLHRFSVAELLRLVESEVFCWEALPGSVETAVFGL